VHPDGPESSGLDDALFGEDTAPNPIAPLPKTTERDDALDEALFGSDASGADRTGIDADDDAGIAAALFGVDASVDAPAAADPVVDTSLFRDAPAAVGAGAATAVVRRAPSDRSPRRGARVGVAAVAALLVLGLGGVAYAVLATRDDGPGKPGVKVRGVSATGSTRPAGTSTSSTTSTTTPTTTTPAPTTTTATATATPTAPVETSPEEPAVTAPPVVVPPTTEPPPSTTTTVPEPTTTTTAAVQP
jgi:hypothetical protein